MKNNQRMRQRISSNKPNFYNSRSQQGQQYFNMKSNDFRHQQNNNLDALSMPQQYMKLVQMYKQQNQDINKKNKALKNTVRQLKQKQNQLLEQIAYLQNYYQSISTKPVQQGIEQLSIEQDEEQEGQNKQNYNYNENSKHEKNKNEIKKNLTVVSSQIQTYYSDAPQKFQNKNQYSLKNLNQQFCNLVEESMNQKDSTRRKQLRKELALLAAQMKKLRKSCNQGEVLNQGQLMKNGTNKTLAPYLQNSDYKNLMRTKSSLLSINSKQGAK